MTWSAVDPSRARQESTCPNSRQGNQCLGQRPRADGPFRARRASTSNGIDPARPGRVAGARAVDIARGGKLALYLLVYALTVLLTSLLWQRPATLTLAYARISLLLLWRSHSRSEIAYFGLAALLGPLGEFVAVGFGAWEYSLPLLKIPIWLPLAYGIVGFGLNKVAGLLLQLHPRSASGNSMEPFQFAPAKASGRCARPTRPTTEMGELIPNRLVASTCRQC